MLKVKYAEIALPFPGCKKNVVVCLISVYVAKQALYCIVWKISVQSKPLLDTFSIIKTIIFSAVWSWCTKPKVKDAKTGTGSIDLAHI